MPKIKKPPPKHILDHLIERFRDGRIAMTDFDGLKIWMDNDPDVPPGKWFKRFKKFILARNGENPSTFLTEGMAVAGEEVDPPKPSPPVK